MRVRVKCSPVEVGMVVNQTAYVPDWAISPPEDQPEVTVEQLNAAKPKHFTLNKAFLFGRVEQVCDVVVSHVSASRVHACLAFDTSRKLHVADLGSTHGIALLTYATAVMITYASVSRALHLPNIIGTAVLVTL